MTEQQTITITVHYLQALRDELGKPEEPMTISEGTTAREALDQLRGKYAELTKWRGAILLAINQQWAKGDEQLSDGDTLALMPPVSGGRSTPHPPTPRFFFFC